MKTKTRSKDKDKEQYFMTAAYSDRASFEQLEQTVRSGIEVEEGIRSDRPNSVGIYEGPAS
jgi:hypothetical protein